MDNTTLTKKHHHPYGMMMPDRDWSSESGYRFGLDGEEAEFDEIGNLNYYFFNYRLLDPRIGRFISIDPLAKQYAFYTPYQFAGNRVINSIDIEGLEDQKFDAIERNDWKAAKALYPNNLDKQFEYVHNNQEHRAIGAAVGGAGLLLLFTAGEALPLLRQAYNLTIINPELTIAVGGLTASVIDPNPSADYPGGFDDLARGFKMIFKSGDVAKFTLDTKRFKFFFGKGADVSKSMDRAEGLAQLGFNESEKGINKLIEYAGKAVDKAPDKPGKINPSTSRYEVFKTVPVIENGVVIGKARFGFSYADESMSDVPEMMTIFKYKE